MEMMGERLTLEPLREEWAIFNLLTQAGVAFTRVKKETMRPAAFVHFSCEADMQRAEEQLPLLQWKGQALSVKPVTSNSRDNRKRKRRDALPSNAAGAGDAASSGAAAAPSAAESSSARRPQKQHMPGPKVAAEGAPAPRLSVQDALTPWHDVPYPEQLARKDAEMRAALRTIALRLRQHILGMRKILLPGERPRTSIAAAGEGAPLPPKDKRKSSGSHSLGPTTLVEQIVPDLGAHLLPIAREQLPAWLLSEHTLGGTVCPFLGLLPSPRVDGYRNKALFTLGFDAADAPTCGARTSGFQGGTEVVSADGTRHIAPEALAIARAVTSFLRASPLAPYRLETHVGVWRTLVVRWSESTRQCMVVVTAKPPKADVTAAAVLGGFSSSSSTHSGGADSLVETYHLELQRLVGMLMTPGGLQPFYAPSPPTGPVDDNAEEAPSTSSAVSSSSSVLASSISAAVPRMSSSSSSSSPAAAAAPFAMSSVFLQEYDGLSAPPPNHPHIHLAGARTVVERLCGLEFEVSPGSFFQVNSSAAEDLYDVVRALAVWGKEGLQHLPPRLRASSEPVPMAGGAGEDPLELELPPSSSAAAAACASSSLPPNNNSNTDSSQQHFLPALLPRNDGITLVDVCCGTGSIALACARHVGRAYGLELSSEAIDDANRNAARNDISNTTFICGDMRETIKKVVTQAAEAASLAQRAALPADVASAVTEGSEAASVHASGATTQLLVAIVDPPRGGLHPDVVRATRGCKAVKRLVYVSCAPTASFVEDALKLCMPADGKPPSAGSVLRGAPFKPICSMSVDLFPHTAHTELVTLFERE